MVMHWNRLVPPPGANFPPLDRRWPKVPAAVAAGTDGTHRYRLQQQLVPLGRTDGPFSSSDTISVTGRVFGEQWGGSDTCVSFRLNAAEILSRIGVEHGN